MRGWRQVRLSAVVTLLALRAIAGQSLVTVRGVVFDSLHSRPLSGAYVLVVGTKLEATTDAAGRFSIDSVPPGTRRIVAQHDVIDALGMSGIGSSFTITSSTDSVRLFVPSFAHLWRLTCGVRPPPADTGLIFGTVRGGGNLNVAGAVVAVSWIDLASNGRSVQQKMKTLEVPADSTGNFALCGVPTSTGLSIRATTDSAASGVYDVLPMDRDRIARRDLRLMRPADSTASAQGALFGRVNADSGRGPVAGADVAITDIGLSTTTDEKGFFRFTGVINGSHTLQARRIGYAPTEIRINIEDGEMREVDLTLSRITMLDSVAVVGKPLARDEAMRVFAEHQKIGLGKFLTQEDLDKAGSRPVRSLLQQLSPMVRFKFIPMEGRWAIYSTRAGKAPCELAMFMDGVRISPPLDVETYPPDRLAGVELYLGLAQLPAEYAGPKSPCGAIVLHSRKK